MTCRMRMFSPTDVQVKSDLEEQAIAKNVGLGIKNGIYIINVAWAGQFSGTSFADIDAPNNEFDGTSTPAKVKAVSTSVNDTAGGNGCKKIRLLGYDANGLTYEDITLNGTTAVETNTSWKRIFHAYSISGTPDGNITITDSTGVTTYLTINAGSLDSNGSFVWIPSGFYFKAKNIRLVVETYTAANQIQTARIYSDGSYCYGNNVNFVSIKASDKNDAEVRNNAFPSLSDGDNDVKIYPKGKYNGGAEDVFLTYDIIIHDPNARGLDSGVLN